MREIGIILILFILLPSVVAGYNYSYNYCDPSNSTLFTAIHLEVPERNITRTIIIPELCSFGCDPERNSCNYPTWLFIVIVMTAIFLTYLGFKFIIIPMVNK